MRGLKTVLVERRDLADGTTGRFHGLLHSGGRYAVKDPEAAKECIEENLVLRRTAADCIEDTGGLFVSTPWDDPAFGDTFVEGCRATGVPVEEIPVAEALEREPRVHPEISRAFTVPDAAIDPWKLVWSCARSAQEHGAQTLLYHRVIGFELDDGRVRGAVVYNELTGEELRIHADVVVNAAGAWAGQVAELAGCRVSVVPGKGIMIAMNHRLVNTVVNRCKMPADGDILVPIRTVCVIGTTDTRVADPDELEVTQAEVAVDAACAQLGIERLSRTHEEPLPDSRDGTFYVLGSRLRAREPVPQSEEIICECELITRQRLEAAVGGRRTANLDDIRRTLRLGMGPCQGGFCIYRATGILHAVERLDHRSANTSLLSFLQERWKGVHPVLYGDQVRQARLDDWIFQGLLGVQHLPS